MTLKFPQYLACFCLFVVFVCFLLFFFFSRKVEYRECFEEKEMNTKYKKLKCYLLEISLDPPLEATDTVKQKQIYQSFLNGSMESLG